MRNLLDVYDAVAAKLESDLGSRGILFFEGNVPTNDAIPQDHGQITPHAALYVGTPGSSIRAGRGIVGYAHDMSSWSGSVMCVAGSSREVLAVVATVADILNGYQPTASCTPIACVPSGFGSPAKDILRPVRYFQTVGFNLAFDAAPVVS